MMTNIEERHVLYFSNEAMKVMVDTDIGYIPKKTSLQAHPLSLTLTAEELKEFRMTALVLGLIVQDRLLSAPYSEKYLQYEYFVKVK